MKKIKKGHVLGLAILAVVAVVLVRAFWPLPNAPLIISKQTTYFTGPLNPDGTVDYVAAFDEKFGEAVKPEDNIARSILRVLGPSVVDADVRAQLLRLLDLELPAEERYFVLLDDHVAANVDVYSALVPLPEVKPETEEDRLLREELEEQYAPLRPKPLTLKDVVKAELDQAQKTPWSADEHRIIAEWLDVNNACLDRLTSDTHLPRSVFVPAVSTATPHRYTQVPVAMDIDSVQELKDALACRAMLLLNKGDIAGAWRDALTMCHIGRLLTRHASGTQHINGVIFQGAGSYAATCIARKGNLSSEQAVKMLNEFEQLPAAGNVAAVDLLDKRLMVLETVARDAMNRGATSVSARFRTSPPLRGMTRTSSCVG